MLEAGEDGREILIAANFCVMLLSDVSKRILRLSIIDLFEFVMELEGN
jgi:hypothetical protein